jgi:hypothetical protein
MPRAKPDGQGCREHRFTLGDFERKEIKEYLDQATKTAKLRNIGYSAAGIGAGAGVIFIGWSLWKMSQALALAAGLGKEAIDTVFTGPEFITTQEGNVIQNPLHGTPLGGTFGFGMNIGGTVSAQEYVDFIDKVTFGIFKD